MYTNIIYITLSYRRILYTEVAYTNCLTGSLNIYIGKTLVFNFSVPSSYLFVNRKLYYNSGLFFKKKYRFN